MRRATVLLSAALLTVSATGSLAETMACPVTSLRDQVAPGLPSHRLPIRPPPEWAWLVHQRPYSLPLPAGLMRANAAFSPPEVALSQGALAKAFPIRAELPRHILATIEFAPGFVRQAPTPEGPGPEDLSLTSDRLAPIPLPSALPLFLMALIFLRMIDRRRPAARRTL